MPFNSGAVVALLLSTCIMIPVATQENFVIQAFFPWAGPNATQCNHWRRAMQLAISSSSHAGQYHLSVISTEDNPSHIIQKALIAARTPSVIAFISIGSESWLQQELQDISHHFLDSSPTSFSIIPNSNSQTKLLQELLSKFDWTDLGLVYPNDLGGIADRKSTLELDQEAQNYTQEGLLLHQMAADIIVIVNTQHNVTRQLFWDALLRRGEATKHRSRIVVLNLASTPPDYLPPGTLLIQLVASLPSKQAEFSHIFHTTSILPPLPPGWNVTVTSELLFTHDAVSSIIQAADIATPSTSFGANARSSIASSMSLSRYDGFSGAITFSKEGIRETSSACVFVAVTKVAESNDDNLVKIKSSLSTHLELVFTFDGTTLSKAGGTIINRGDEGSLAPLVPSNTPLTFRVPLIYSFTGETASIAPEFSVELAKYAVFRLNEPTRPHGKPGTLPTGAQIEQSPFIDDKNLPVLAVRAAINISLSNNVTPVLGVVGAYTSTMSSAVQTVLSSFGIPQLSPSSTSPQLSNKIRFPTFARVCSSDINIARVIISLSSEWKWNRLHMVSSSDDYSSSLSRSIVAEADKSGIEIGTHVIVEPQLPSYTLQLEDLAKIQPRILLLMVGSDSLFSMISSLFRSNIHPVAVVAPNTIGNLDMNFYAQQANVSVSYFKGWVALSDPIGFGPEYASFLDEISNLDRSVWPHVADAIKFVPRLVSLLDCYMVWADVIRRGSASGLDFTNLSAVHQELLQTSIVSLSGNLSFLPNGDRPPTYEVFNVQNNRQVHLGRWEENTTIADIGTVIWPDGTTTVPIAVPHEWLRFTSPAGITFAVLAAVGIALCLFIIGIFIWQRKSRIVLAATWQFLIIMLIGAIIGLASVFCWLAKPSKLICSLRIWLPTIAFTLILSPLLAKTWRLARIFRTNTLEIKPTPLSHLIIIVSTLLGIQIIINILWITLGSLQTRLILDSSRTHTLVLCTLNRYNHIFLYITLGYQGLLLLFGVYLAFRVRKVPRTYNESVWIARSIYNIALFAGLMIILGYALGQFHIVVLILICVGTTALTYTTMALLMGPKLYRLWKHPEERKGGQTSQQQSKRQSSTAQSAPTTSPSSQQLSSSQASPASPSSDIVDDTTSAHGKDDSMDMEMNTKSASKMMIPPRRQQKMGHS